MNEPNPAGRLAYTVKEVLQLVPMSRKKFYQVAKSGRLRVRKDGRINLILAEDLNAYLNSLPLADFVHKRD
jgi:excisionase family DNA binding protein